MERIYLLVAGVMGFLGVAMGAFGAHGLRKWLADKPDGADRAAWWQTGAQYHLVHALAIGLCSPVAARVPGGTIAGFFFLAGIVLFSGSLYTMTLTGKRVLGAVTPIGGLCFLGGWLALAAVALAITA